MLIFKRAVIGAIFIASMIVVANLSASDLYLETAIASHAGIGLGEYQLTTQVNSGRLKAEYEQSTWSIKFDGRLEYDAVFDLRSSYSDDAEDEYRARFWLDDGYITWQGSVFELTLGYQKIVWGQADDLRVVDVINPLNLKDFVLFDIDEYRISLPMLRFETAFAGWNWQALGVLQTKPNHLPPQGSEFPLSPPNIDKEDTPGESEYGLRGQVFWLDTDIALYSFRGYFDNPVVIFPNGEARLTYKRETMWGASASRPLSDLVVRAEVAQFVGRSFNDVSGVVTNSDVSQWLLGLDYLYQDWLITAQVTDSYIHDWTPLFQVNKSEPLYTLSADGRLFSDMINLRFAITHADYDGGGLLYQTKLAYRPNQHWEWRAHLDILSGDTTNFLGQFRDRDRLWFALTYTF